MPRSRLSVLARLAVVVVSAFVSIYFLIAPAVIVASDLRDPALRAPGAPAFAYRWHRQLSDDFAAWATARVSSDRALELGLEDIAGTEWPMFSSVFFLWATEALQRQWQLNPSIFAEEPTHYARDAVEAAAALIADPNHAAWVRVHWGDDYLQQENLFYRMLLIAGLTSYQQLLGSDRYQELLGSQALSLAAELDRSPSGLLDDYPGQCYPIDVLPAIAAIEQAGRILGIDFSDFVDRSMRGFQGDALDLETGLPGYVVDADSGRALSVSRGVGASYMLIWAQSLWPELASQWYTSFEQHFVERNALFLGVREFSAAARMPDWLVEVDAGPVVAGYGTAASSFGIGAARVNGRLDHALPLSALAVAASWPLLDGTRLAPRLLSSLTDAPFTGEAILLFVLTRQPGEGLTLVEGGRVPPAAHAIWIVQLIVGLVLLRAAARRVI